MSPSLRTVAELRALAQRVLDHVKLEDTFLSSVESSGSSSPTEGPFDVNSKLGVRGAQRSDGTVETWSRYDLSAVPTGASDDPQAERAWHMEFELVAVFTPDQDSTEEDAEPEPVEKFTQDELQSFALVVGSVTLHPFARELARDLSARLGYAAYTLPLLEPVSARPDDAPVEFDFEDEEDS